MKNIVISSLFVLFFSAIACAQSTPVADQREQNQRARIRDGVESGEVSKPEAARLKAEQRHIKRTERRAKSDGQVTPRERAKIQRKQNKASRDIRKQKRDGQTRP